MAHSVLTQQNSIHGDDTQNKNRTTTYHYTAQIKDKKSFLSHLLHPKYPPVHDYIILDAVYGMVQQLVAGHIELDLFCNFVASKSLQFQISPLNSEIKCQNNIYKCRRELNGQYNLEVYLTPIVLVTQETKQGVPFVPSPWRCRFTWPVWDNVNLCILYQRMITLSSMGSPSSLAVSTEELRKEREAKTPCGNCREHEVHSSYSVRSDLALSLPHSPRCLILSPSTLGTGTLHPALSQ